MLIYHGRNEKITLNKQKVGVALSPQKNVWGTIFPTQECWLEHYFPFEIVPFQVTYPGNLL